MYLTHSDHRLLPIMRLWLLQNETVHSSVLGEDEDGGMGGPAQSSKPQVGKLALNEHLLCARGFPRY